MSSLNRNEKVRGTMDSRVDQIFSRRINEKADRKCILAGRYGCKIDKIQLGVRKKIGVETKEARL